MAKPNDGADANAGIRADDYKILDVVRSQNSTVFFALVQKVSPATVGLPTLYRFSGADIKRFEVTSCRKEGNGYIVTCKARNLTLVYISFDGLCLIYPANAVNRVQAATSYIRLDRNNFELKLADDQLQLVAKSVKVDCTVLEQLRRQATGYMYVAARDARRQPLISYVEHIREYVRILVVKDDASAGRACSAALQDVNDLKKVLDSYDEMSRGSLVKTSDVRSFVSRLNMAVADLVRSSTPG